MNRTRLHFSGWARHALHVLAVLSTGGLHALAQTDIDTPFSGTIGPDDIINLVAPGGTVNGPVSNSGQLWFSNPDLPSQTISSAITGTGGMLVLQPVNITFTANNTFGSGVILYDGTTSLPGSMVGPGVLEIDGPAGTLLNISGTMSNGDAFFANTVGQEGNVNLTSGLWSSATLYAGQNGSSDVVISGGRMTTSGQAYFGYLDGAQGSLSITSGSFVPSTTVSIGYFGTGSLSVAGGRLLAAGDLYVGYAGTGTASLTSGTISTGGMLTVGKNSVGAMTVDGGSLTTASAVIGQSASGTGTVTINSSLWQVTNALEVGSTTGGVGNLVINGGGVTSNVGLVGNLAGSTGNVSITSGSWSLTGFNPPNGNLQVGNYGTGTMTVSGGSVTANGGSIGTDNAGNGTMIVNGGALSIANLLYVGNFARGNLQVSSGTLTTGQVIVGASSQLGFTGTGTVLVSGGVWNSSLSLTVGQFGNGTYTQTGGSVSAAAGYIGSANGLATGGTGSVTVTGGTLAYAGNVNVGNTLAGSTGTGTMTVGGGGFISVANTLSRASNGTINVNPGGTLSIGIGGTTGALATSLTDNGLVIFNRTTNYTYPNSISGTGSVTKLGASTLTISGSNSYSGDTSVITGTMNVTGQLGLTNLTVYSAAALSGTGSILGPVTIDANGTITPGVAGVGSLGVGDFAMAGSTALALMEITGSATGQYDQVAAAGSNSLNWGLGTVAVTMNTTSSYVVGTVFHLFSGFNAYASTISNISLSAAGTDYAGLTFSDAGSGLWQTGRNGSNQYLEFNTSTGNLHVVPEPTTFAAVGICSFGLGVLLLANRRRVDD